MAKKKVAIDIKLDMFSEINKKDIDRLLKMPFRLKQKDFEFTVKKTVEVVDPAWTPKIFQQNLYYSVRRDLQVLAVRAFEALKAYDNEKVMNKQMALVFKLQKKLNKSAKSISSRAEINLKTITDAANKSSTKWDKKKVAKLGGEMKDIEKGRDYIIILTQNLEKELLAGHGVFKKIMDKVNKEKTALGVLKNKRLKTLNSKKSDGSTDTVEKIREEIDAEKDKLSAELKKAKANRVKSATQTFAAYRSDRKSFHDLLKGAIKMAQKNESKDKNDKKDKDIVKLNEIFKKMSKAAKNFGTYLNDSDKDVAELIKKMKDDGVDAYTIQMAMPYAGEGGGPEFFDFVDDAQRQLKKIKI